MERAAIPVERRRGTFGSVSVSWSISPSDGLDLIPVLGTVLFGPGENLGYVSLTSVADDVSYDIYCQFCSKY